MHTLKKQISFVPCTYHSLRGKEVPNNSFIQNINREKYKAIYTIFFAFNLFLYIVDILYDLQFSKHYLRSSNSNSDEKQIHLHFLLVTCHKYNLIFIYDNILTYTSP